MIAFHPTREAALAHLASLGFRPVERLPLKFQPLDELDTIYCLDRHGRGGVVASRRPGTWEAATWLSCDPDSLALHRANLSLFADQDSPELARTRAWLTKTGIA